MFASLTAGGIGLILAGIVAICIWKGHGKKLPAWLALFAGLFGSYTVLGWLGGIAADTVAGIAITTVVVILGGFLFWLEAVKDKGHHKWRTPIIAFAVGVALMAGNGGIQHAVQQGTVHLTSVVQHSTGR